MAQLMKLKGRVGLAENGWYTFYGTLFDKSPFDVLVQEHDVVLNKPFDKERLVDGWLYVKQESRQDNRIAVTLPQPSLQHGRNILVHEYQLMPRSATLQDFNPQTSQKNVKKNFKQKR